MIVHLTKTYLHGQSKFCNCSYPREFKMLNDTDREELYFTQFSTRNAGWLILTYVYTVSQVLYIPLSCIKEYRCLKNVIHQIDSKKECLLLSTSFTAKFVLVFVLTPENAVFRGFFLKPIERA